MKKLLFLLLPVWLSVFLWSCEKEIPAVNPPPELEALNMLLGNPSQAVTDISSSNNYLIVLPQYALSYNRSRGIPNWVSWYLNNAWIGNAPRQDDFRAYAALPAGWYQVGNFDYVGSGFDRGHNCPSADRTITIQDNSATFYMINIIPQAPGVNQGPWERLEAYCRKLMRDGHELYIVMGNYGIGGIGTNGTAQTVSNGKVTVPAIVWKAILVLPIGQDDINRITTSTRLIAVSIPNQNVAANLSWGDYRTTVNQIETATGYDLFSKIPIPIQDELEARKDTGPTQ
jgi:endonuclease G